MQVKNLGSRDHSHVLSHCLFLSGFQILWVMARAIPENPVRQPKGFDRWVIVLRDALRGGPGRTALSGKGGFALGLG